MLVKTARQNLMKLVDAYRKHTGDPLATISKKFYGTGVFLEGFKKDKKSISIHKLESVVAKFKAQWPEGLAWPELKPVPMDDFSQGQ